MLVYPSNKYNHFCIIASANSFGMALVSTLPPSTGNNTPVIHPAESDAKKAIASATSLGSPARGSG
jgi:hypothetical protein